MERPGVIAATTARRTARAAPPCRFVTAPGSRPNCLYSPRLSARHLRAHDGGPLPPEAGKLRRD